MTDAAIVGVLCLMLLLGFQLYVDNVFIITTNGLWKSVTVRQWAHHPDLSKLDLANVLYFPIYGGLTRVLDALRVFPGITWKQMAVLNAFFAAAVLGCIHYWISALFSSRLIALLTVLFYLGSGHFLTLAIINEDIMPSYFFALVAMMLGGMWLGRPSTKRILAVALTVSIAWLFEWRLLFPLVPPILVALWLSAADWKRRCQRALWFLSGLCVLPALVTLLVASRLQMDMTTALAFLGRLFWVGKGIGTGWAGFSAEKMKLIWAGMSESVIGGRYLQSDDWMNHPANIWEVTAGTLLLLLLATVALHAAWQRRSDSRVLAHAIIFGGTFVAGEIFNAYSQPQDPQMQLNVLPWMIPAWSLLMARWLSRGRRSGLTAIDAARRQRLVALTAVLASLFPMATTAPVIAAARGGDARYLAVLNRLEQQWDPSRTVYLYLGFDAVIPWQFATWSASWPDVEHLPPAPAETPKFKWISITDGMIWHRDWTPERQALELKHKIDRAMELGFRVVTNRLWELPERTWVETTVTIAPPETTRAIRQMLLQSFRAEAVYVDPTAGPFFELRSGQGTGLAPKSAP